MYNTIVNITATINYENFVQLITNNHYILTLGNQCGLEDH